LTAIQIEAVAVASIQKLGFSASDAVDILTSSTAAKSQEEVSEHEIFDIREILKSGEKSAVIWWNDLTKDKRYASWSSSLFEVGGIDKTIMLTGRC
jgi:UDP-glucose:glycoprotein glucosyltransferase